MNTPGEWEAYEAKHGWIVEAPGSTPSSRVTICSVYETALTTDQPDRAPIDAQLIAAAPDLLAWLTSAQEHLRSYRAYSEAMAKLGRGHVPSSQFSPEYLESAIEQAIAKAKGGSR
jgi:hypothetical protein